MSYLEPFQSVALFENTFRHQLNKKTGKIDERKFVFDKHFGDGEGQLPVVPDRYRLIWMPGCPHSNKAMITLRLLGLTFSDFYPVIPSQNNFPAFIVNT